VVSVGPHIYERENAVLTWYHRDQELRYTVHDSPDYYTLKISVFSEEKRTDLVGEAWVSLKDVIVPGGGKSDIWQGLNCKGKYAGEIRMEMTYYDNRPKPEKGTAEEETAGIRQSVGSGGRVKRRPLPTNPNAGSITPDTIPELAGPVRAKHGPRDYRTPPRAHSMPPEMNNYQHQQMHSLYGHQPLAHAASQGNSPSSSPCRLITSALARSGSSTSRPSSPPY